MYTRTALTLATMLTLASACSGKNADENNDTQFGDDDGGVGADETGGGPDGPPPVEDHGIANYCVVRAEADNMKVNGVGGYNLLEVHSNELWYHALQRGYGGALDTSDKPSPSIVPNALPSQGGSSFVWPLRWHYLDDAQERGGNATGLLSSYHFQLPAPGFSSLLEPSPWQLPYSVDIVSQAAVPGEAFRHSAMGPGCCSIPPTETELQEWEDVAGTVPASPNADCWLYVMAVSTNTDELGYPRWGSATRSQLASQAKCMHGGGGYSPIYGAAAALARLAVGKLAVPAPYPNGIDAWQAPALFNYHWIEALASNVDWAEIITDAVEVGASAWVLTKLNVPVAAVVSAVLWVANNFYLPPDDVEHARYGIGGMCAFPMHVFLDHETNSWWADVTCPRGYVGAMPQFSHLAPDVRSAGQAGTCQLDGVDGSPLVDDGSVLAPSAMGRYMYHVADVYEFAAILDDVDGVVTQDLAAAVGHADELRFDFYEVDRESALIEAGDTIAWSSTPDGVSLTPGNAMLASIGYDYDALERLSEVLGWSREDILSWIDEQPIGTMGELLPDIALPDELKVRSSVSLRRHHAWRLRVVADKDGDGIKETVTSLHFAG